MRVKDKSIIVTGAGGGIGEGIAKRLAAEGAQVIVNDINQALGEQVVEAILRDGGRASFFAADVTKSDQMKALVDRGRLVALGTPSELKHTTMTGGLLLVE